LLAPFAALRTLQLSWLDADPALIAEGVQPLRSLEHLDLNPRMGNDWGFFARGWEMQRLTRA